MEMIQHFTARPTLQRSKTDGEDELSRLGEPELLARLAENARRLESLQTPFGPDLSSEPLHL
jgi:hypothetical protein